MRRCERKWWRLAVWVLAGGMLLTTGCATNPVTRRSEIRLVSERREISLGQQNYLSYQQMQGGAYLLEPEVQAYVQRVGTRLWRVSDRPHLPYEITVLNNSVPNAWAIPGGKMAINRGLLTELQSEAELAAVLAHEIVHVAAGHGANQLERGMGMQALLLGVGLLAKDHDASDLIVGGSGVAAGLMVTKFGRDDELEADRYGIEYMVRAGYDPQAAVDLQQTFLTLNDRREPGWLAGLFSTHPPTRERVEKNRETVKGYPAGGELGREAYARVMAPLRQAQPAYEELEKGYRALNAKQPDAALTHAREALRLEPREAHFHNLAAKALLARGDSRGAREHLDRAIALNDQYFEFFLQRGKLRQEAGDRAGARGDLERSLSLLPTASAQYQLGTLARDAGRRDQALTHFRAASGAGSQEGQMAAVALATMELAERPERHLQLNHQVNAQGMVTVTVRNPTPVDVGEAVVGVWNPQTRAWESYRFPRGVPARRLARLDTRVGPLTDPAQARAVRLRFETVRVAGAR